MKRGRRPDGRGLQRKLSFGHAVVLEGWGGSWGGGGRSHRGTHLYSKLTEELLQKQTMCATAWPAGFTKKAPRRVCCGRWSKRTPPSPCKGRDGSDPLPHNQVGGAPVPVACTLHMAMRVVQGDFSRAIAKCPPPVWGLLGKKKVCVPEFGPQFRAPSGFS